MPTSDRKPVSLSLNNAPTEDTSSPVVLEGQMLLNANSKYQSNSAADIHRSADGPLTALVISPISACMTGYGCSLFVAAAAAGNIEVTDIELS